MRSTHGDAAPTQGGARSGSTSSWAMAPGRPVGGESVSLRRMMRVTDAGHFLAGKGRTREGAWGPSTIRASPQILATCSSTTRGDKAHSKSTTLHRSADQTSSIETIGTSASPAEEHGDRWPR